MTVGLHDQRVDIDGNNVCSIHRDLRKSDQALHHFIGVHCGFSTELFQQTLGTQRRQHGPCHVLGNWRWAESNVLQNFGHNAAHSQHDRWSELLVHQ